MTRQLWRPGQRQVILWAQVGGLAALQSAISLAWLTYNLYVPNLLAQFGFPPAVGVIVLIVENILGIAMEPFMGSLSDRTQRWLGTRFPMIALGILGSAALFMGIPAIALWGTGSPAGNGTMPQVLLRWLFLAVLVLWSLAMAVFRSPALALLGSYAFTPKLPQAASWISMSSALVGFTGIVAKPLILSWGPLATFALGSGVLIATVIGLRQVNPDVQISLSTTGTQLKRPTISGVQLGCIFAAGLGIALGSALLRTLVGGKPIAGGVSLAVIFSIAHIVTILPAGAMAVRWGNVSAMRVGIGAIALGTLLLPWTKGTLLEVGLTAVVGVAFSLIANGTLPFALSLVPSTQAGLGTGMFFSGSALAGALLGLATQSWGAILPGTAAWAGAIAFVWAGGCISLAPRSQ